MSSAGIQAGPPAGGTLAVEKGKPQIQFSGKSGVSYFEQLMMKRHRYDPTCLSRAVKHTHTTQRNREDDISSESNNDRDLPIDEEGTLSNYNIFYDLEPVESRLPHSDNEKEKYISTATPPAVPGSTAAVEIVELNVGQSISSARPDNVRILPVQLSIEKTSSKPGVVKPKLSKSSEGTHTRPKSTNKKRIQSSRLKSTSKRRTHSSASSCCPSPKASSELSESDIQASVKQAWTNCSEQAQLTQFFLHGVEVTDDKVDNDAKIPRALTNTEHKVTMISKLSSTIWLPGNSIMSCSESTNTNLDSLEINPATDLPPALMSRPESQHNNPPSLASAQTVTNSGDDPVSESDNEDSPELELSVSNIEEEGDILAAERQERDEEDEEALESLAWELASTVECEGRLTRCQSEMDKLDNEIGDALSHPSTPTAEQQEPWLGEEDQAFVLSDLSQVMSEFELYRQRVMEQDSD